MRKAAAGWDYNYVGKLVGDGFKRGVGAPAVFHNPRTGVRLVVHGDGFTFSGTRRELEVIMGAYEGVVRGEGSWDHG